MDCASSNFVHCLSVFSRTNAFDVCVITDLIRIANAYDFDKGSTPYAGGFCSVSLEQKTR